MKKSLLALAVAAAVSPAAFAQTNVTLYGIVDAGVSFDRVGSTPVTNAAGQTVGFANNTSYTTRINSGYMSTSRFGITGVEDLGGGLKGLFTLEMGVAVDTGAFSTNGQNQPAFNRRSFVGVQGGFGTVALGRDYTPFFWAQLATDNLGYGLYGNLLNEIDVVGSSNQFLRADNAVFYTSPKFGGLTVRAMASAGNENISGVRALGRMYGIGGEYGAGPLTVAAAFQTRALQNAVGTGTSDRRDYVVGAKYNFGLFSLGAGYAGIDPPGGNNRADQYWLGGSIGLGRGSLLAQWAQMRQDAPAGLKPRANTYAVAFTYPFSRRTTGYVSYGQVNNNATSSIRLWASDNFVGNAGAAGADPRGLVLGIRHSF